MRSIVKIYRSNTSFEAQLIDGDKTLIGKKFKFSKSSKPAEQSKEFGLEFGKLISEAKVKQISFDRNGFRYHGKVKAFADGIREAGIEF
jgi:large subunit ribosomal protein L18